jgi:predicted DNA-binding transcriptional regulator AlpA
VKNDETVWVTSAQIIRRFGISQMALWRWTHKPELNFPAPVQISERNYWRLEEIVDWERKAAAETAGRRAEARQTRIERSGRVTRSGIDR